jgi:hypothetical protein
MKHAFTLVWQQWVAQEIESCRAILDLSKKFRACRFARSFPAKPRNAITPCWNNLPWRRDSNQMASDEPGAVHISIAAAS